MVTKAGEVDGWHITHLGEGDQAEDWSHETGCPGIGLFATAIQVWSVAQNRTTTIDEAAEVFRVETELVRKAVEWHPWMFLEDDLILHEGE